MTLIVGFVAGIIAKFVVPGKNEPSGFLLTTLLGVIGAFVFTFLGRTVGLYDGGEGARFIGATIGAILVLAAWGWWQKRRVASD